MEDTSGPKKMVIDIGATVEKHKRVIASQLAIHSLTGCDSVSNLFGIGKATALKIFEKGDLLQLLGVFR